MLHCEAEQSLEQGQCFSNSNPSTQLKHGKGEPNLAGSHASQAHGAPQGGWVQDQAPQPWCQAETQERMTYRRTICTRHARKTGFAQRPLKTNRKPTAAMIRVSRASEDGAFQTHFLLFLAVKGCREASLLEKLPRLVGSLISVGRVVPASWDAAVLAPAPHTHRRDTVTRAQQETPEPKGIKLLSCRTGTMLHVCIRPSWRISNYGARWTEKCPFFGDKWQGN